MINFRYHVVSIVAVFLALAIGIVMGSTVIDRAIVDSLRSQIKSAEKNSIDRKVENEALKKQLAGLQDQVTVLGAHSVRGYLNDQNVYVVTIGDVNDETRVETLELLATSGATVPSVVRYKSDYLQGDKEKVFKELKKLPNVEAFVSTITNKDEQVSKILEEALAVQAGQPNNSNIPAQEIINVAINNNVFDQQELKEVQAKNVSFIYLVQRAALQNKQTADFVAHLPANYATSLGYAGAEVDRPTRSNSIKKLGTSTKKFQILDNAEAPSGRTALVIAHANAIGGERTIFGVSDQAKAPAPPFEG